MPAGDRGSQHPPPPASRRRFPPSRSRSGAATVSCGSGRAVGAAHCANTHATARLRAGWHSGESGAGANASAGPPAQPTTAPARHPSPPNQGLPNSRPEIPACLIRSRGDARHVTRCRARGRCSGVLGEWAGYQAIDHGDRSAHRAASRDGGRVGPKPESRRPTTERRAANWRELREGSAGARGGVRCRRSRARWGARS